MSKKSAKIATLIEACHGRALPAHYLGFFECFNIGLYYEAHDVLEEMWLPVRKRPEGDFYKGLIQLAGAFVHLQKGRTDPGRRLFLLARANLLKFPACHQCLDVTVVLGLIDAWLERIARPDFSLGAFTPPHLGLIPAGSV